MITVNKDGIRVVKQTTADMLTGSYFMYKDTLYRKVRIGSHVKFINAETGIEVLQAGCDVDGQLPLSDYSFAIVELDATVIPLMLGNRN